MIRQRAARGERSASPAGAAVPTHDQARVGLRHVRPIPWPSAGGVAAGLDLSVGQPASGSCHAAAWPLAVPPAYRDGLCGGSAAHLQATGRDSEGRLQCRYHPHWEKVREVRKTRRLARLADALPRIHRSLGRHLAAAEPTRHLAFAAVIELVARTAIRPGSEAYARLRGTRGAATLLKSNVKIYGETITLTFRGKGGKTVVKECTAARLANVIALLQQLPGRRLFQYRAENGDLRHVTAREVNTFLRAIAGMRISLKDFRTLLASASVFEMLARAEPAASERKRRKQILEAVRRGRHARQYAGHLPQELRASDRRDGLRGRRLGTVRRRAQALPVGTPAGPVAGQDHLGRRGT